MSESAHTQLVPTPYSADVAIVGGGPVGTLLAVLLGKQGKRVALIERWEEAYARPRAVTFDHDGLRAAAAGHSGAIVWDVDE